MTGRQLMVLNLVVFLLGGAVCTLVAFGPDPQPPKVANANAPTNDEAVALSDHNLEVEMRESWRTGFGNGIWWALTLGQILFAIIALDLLIEFITFPKPGPLKQLYLDIVPGWLPALFAYDSMKLNKMLIDTRCR